MSRVERVQALLLEVMDPELPFLNVVEMGMIKGVEETSAGHIKVRLSPTYSGCPATDFIREDVERVVRQVDSAGEVEVVLTPAWSTDDLAPTALRKMAENGIAPPEERKGDKGFLIGEAHRVPCPRCKSQRTEMVSAFGSTACKAHFKCLDCLEPFDHFKCL